MSGVLHNKDNDKTNNLFIYHAFTFSLLRNHYSGYEKLGVVSPLDGEKDQHYLWILVAITVKQLSK
jgi:hypothetical protein